MKRRAFAASLALGALAGMVGWPGRHLAPAVAAERVGSGGASPRGGLAAMLVEVVRLEHGDHLSADDLRALALDIEAGLDRAERVRRAELRARGPAVDLFRA